MTKNINSEVIQKKLKMCLYRLHGDKIGWILRSPCYTFPECPAEVAERDDGKWTGTHVLPGDDCGCVIMCGVTGCDKLAVIPRVC